MQSLCATGWKRATRCARSLYTVCANDRTYAIPKHRPVVGILLDGNEEDYVVAARAAGKMPNWDRIASREEGSRRASYGLVRACMPTFTNPNNTAVVTGAPPAVNGICGNYFIDEATGEETMMNDPSFLRCGTIFAALAGAGVPVYVGTCKLKLLKLLTHGLDRQRASPWFGFSAETADDDATSALLEAAFPIAAGGRTKTSGRTVTDMMAGAPPPSIYDPGCSVYVLEAGAALLREHAAQPGRAPPVLYLSTTDFVQHKYEPGEPEALAFYYAVDAAIGALDALGAVVGVTADHGMKDKTVQPGGPDNTPQILMVESHLEAAGVACRAILPITDPYVVHHGALGSYATVYLDDKADLARAVALLEEHPLVSRTLGREEAAQAYELPPDRIGDVVVVASEHAVLGRTPEYHDLDVVPRLRSHGGESEQVVPMLVNRPLREPWGARLAAGELRNFDLYDLLLNGVDDSVSEG